MLSHVNKQTHKSVEKAIWNDGGTYVCMFKMDIKNRQTINIIPKNDYNVVEKTSLAVSFITMLVLYSISYSI